MPPKVKSYDSIKSAAAAMGISAEILQRAKNCGCPSFRGSRVYPEGLRQFLSDHDEELKAMGGASLKDAKLEEEIRKLKINNDRAAKILVLKTKIIAFFHGFTAEHRAALHQVLENEYPTAVAGMDPPQARILGKRLADKLDEIAQRHGSKLEEIE